MPVSLSWGGPLELDPELSLSAALARAARQVPRHGITHVTSDGREDFQSYPALLAEAERARLGLAAAGVAPGAALVLQLETSRALLTTLWGCLLGGVVPVPLPLAAKDDPAGQESAKKLGIVWNLLGRPAVACARGHAGRMEAILGGAAPGIVTWEDLSGSTGESVRAPAPLARLGDRALLLFTSGSTGVPKGVPLTHGNLLAMAEGTIRANHFTSAEVTCNWLGLDHVGAVSFLHLLPTILGARQIHVATDVVLADLLRWMELMTRHRVTVSWAPNFAFGLIARQADELAGRSLDLRALRFLVNAGEGVAPATMRRFCQLLGPFGLAPSAVRPAFGMSETCSGITWSKGLDLSALEEGSFVDLGPPIPGASLRIVDEGGQIVEEGTVGRLQLRGPSVFSGYFPDIAANREVLLADGWFDTGDRGFLRDGHLVLTGRDKEIVIVHGVHYPCRRIEEIVESLEGVAASYTVATDLRPPGADTDELAIFFHAADPARRDDLVREIRGALARVLGIAPRVIVPVEMAEVPKTSIGKLQRSVLRERFLAGGLSGRSLAALLGAEAGASGEPALKRLQWRRSPRAEGPRAEPRGVLLLHDEPDTTICLARRLERRLIPAGYRVVVAATGRLEARDQWLTSARREFGDVPLATIFYLGALSRPDFTLSDVGAVGASPIRGYAGALELVQGCLAASQADLPRLVLVSRGVGDVGTGTATLIAGSTLWGLAAVARVEQPQLPLGIVDLDPTDPLADVDSLTRELGHADGESHVAWRAGDRWVARLVPFDPGAAVQSSAPLPPDGAVLTSSSSVLESLAWRPDGAPKPSTREVTIAARALGLARTDLARVFEKSETQEDPVDFVGTVREVGSDVGGLEAGDSVIGRMPWPTRTAVTLPSDSVAKIPDGIPADAALSVAWPSLAARRALEPLGRIEPGVAYFVHEAAEPLGLALVELIRAAGGTVCATARSPRLRQLLTDWGVPFVISSRRPLDSGALADFLGERRLCAVIDSIGSANSIAAAAFLRPGGNHVLVGGAVGVKGFDSGRRSDIRVHRVDLSGLAPSEVAFGLARALAAGSLPRLPARLFTGERPADGFARLGSSETAARTLLSLPAKRVPRRPWGERGTFLVTGASGGIGRQLARWLAGMGVTDLALLCRKPPSAEAAGEVVASGKATRARWFAVDVADEAALAVVTATIGREMPPPRGIFHLAGCAEGALLGEQTPESFERVARAKVLGAWNLHRLTMRLELDHFVLFSSLAALPGSPGQADYAAANAWLEGLARFRVRLGLPALAITWGPWRETGMSARISAREEQFLRRHGIGLLAPADALATLGRLLEADAKREGGVVGAYALDPARFAEQFAGYRPPSVFEGLGGVAAPKPDAERARDLGPLSPERRRAVLGDVVARLAAKLLLGDASATIDPDRSLAELGLNSLSAVLFTRGLSQRLGRPISAKLLFEHPTVAALVDYLASGGGSEGS